MHYAKNGNKNRSDSYMTIREGLLAIKRMQWYIQSGDIDGMCNFMAEDWNDEPEPLKNLMLDNIEFRRFFAHNIGDSDVENAYGLAHRFTSRLIETATVEEDDRDSIINILHQEFYELFIEKDWRAK